MAVCRHWKLKITGFQNVSFYQRMSLLKITLLINPNFQIKGIDDLEISKFSYSNHKITIRRYQDYIILKFGLIFWNTSRILDWLLVMGMGGRLRCLPSWSFFLWDSYRHENKGWRWRQAKYHLIVNWSSVPGTMADSWEAGWHIWLGWDLTVCCLLLSSSTVPNSKEKMSWRAIWF